MEAVFDRCCGLDVHKRTVVACCGQERDRDLRHNNGGSPWLSSRRVPYVAGEHGGGVHWKPVRTILEVSFSILLIDAARIKAVLAACRTNEFSICKNGLTYSRPISYNG